MNIPDMSDKIFDAQTLVGTVLDLNAALFMAAESLVTANPTWANALTSVSHEMDTKLRIIEDRLGEILEAAR